MKRSEGLMVIVMVVGVGVGGEEGAEKGGFIFYNLFQISPNLLFFSRPCLLGFAYRSYRVRFLIALIQW